MKKILLVAAIFAALSACASRPSGQEGPAWERNDPARRVYGGGAA